MNSHQRRVTERASVRAWMKSGAKGERYHRASKGSIVLRRPGLIAHISTSVHACDSIEQHLSHGVMIEECRIPHSMMFSYSGWKRTRF